ncbi:30S ribosomal protein S7 [candidate division WWE3 bacterium RIFOXYC1_FULL_40_10]|uniref:Small ribosomal subunit protein uS7 n=1 Tax=candidate division WWE3 bacterium RIFOXYA2_FULL_46_9 TaxID=1802636 RepID=A0A1F4VYI4_UNCKA|nr:MAG: 30S ribosomal protein S7 [candidate division WWE3 bacterium RIFOXYB1_FULL_40_22]OGC61872.1 MAG: 30S ribosomal protein S7 [candidate division WWE3 bacterium RIFOXYA1_FULL_40_11]OGC62239.1 MAG: 30S ribosomal protein S7 [candidate division WWE3 bacterium RIFOXYA2_FULL_46_9]OGC64345.1 MAG: 30S ribosomal protein S7 [candidate division WWE3 bacterium RIFOXYB2_FULL_41_6]OGC66255.1 MAG: 30S ribosomal protein S7 [candidate division WWE3 bacterium RIFOXYC1_FULL_40_10]OGC67861.1 MAG: 30S ribosoma
MRGKKAKKRQVIPDQIFKSRVVSKMISIVMQRGQKATAESIVYGAIDKLAEDRKDAIKKFEDAIKNVIPLQEVRSRRVGGATYQVPVPVKHERAEGLALRWLVGSARSKKGKTMEVKLFNELNMALDGTGDAVKKRDDTHKMADANRAFAHFARY